MEALLAKAGDTLIGLGLAGIVILGLTAALVAVYKQNQSIQSARIDDAKSMAKIIEQNSVETKLSTEVMRQVMAEIRQALADILRDRRHGQ